MVLLGAVVMAAGHFTLGFHDAFFVGLLLIIVGSVAAPDYVATTIQWP